MRDTLVLCYHALSPDWAADLSVRPDLFTRQLEFVAARGYRGTTFKEAVSVRARGKRVAVTFDDAFASVAELALPPLQRLGWPATVFAVTDFAGSGAPLAWAGTDHWSDGPHAGELRGLSWQQLRSLADGGWEIGSHTRSHPRLTQLTDSELSVELAGSRAICEAEMGRPCQSIAYPYGDVDDRVVAAAAAAGYSAAGTLPARLHRPAPHFWPRIGVYHPDEMARFRIKVAPSVRTLRTLARR